MTTRQVELPPKLIPVFTGEARYRGAYGGRGSAKTRSFAKMAAVRGLMLSQAGQEGLIVCGREYMNSLSESSFAEVKAAINSEPWLRAQYDIGERYIRTLDKRINFEFCGLRVNLESLKSKARIHILWVDEAEEVSEPAWQIVIPTVREHDSEIWVTWNPKRKHSATSKRFRLDPPVGSRIVEVNWSDNPWFPEVLNRDRLEDLEKRPDSYAHIWEGAYGSIVQGAYYAKQMLDARMQGRIRSVDIDPKFPVHTAWDLGYGDSTAIWCFQTIGNEIRLVDYIENHSRPLGFYHDELEARGYSGVTWLPHDAEAHELGTGRTRIETLRQLGRSCRIVQRHKVDDGINGVRETLPICYFDEKRTEAGLECLAEYRAEYDDKRGVFHDRPLHNWASHGADAFRYLAMAWRSQAGLTNEQKRPLSGYSSKRPDYSDDWKVA